MKKMLVHIFTSFTNRQSVVGLHIFTSFTNRQSVVALDLFSLIREPNLCNVKAYRFHCYRQSAARVQAVWSTFDSVKQILETLVIRTLFPSTSFHVCVITALIRVREGNVFYHFCLSFCLQVTTACDAIGQSQVTWETPVVFKLVHPCPISPRHV